MANSRKLSYVLIAGATMFAALATVGCKPPIVPDDDSIIKTYRDNRKSYDEVAEILLKEANQKFSVDRNGNVKYFGTDKPEVSLKARRACQQIMSRTFCLLIRRDGVLINFIFFEDLTRDHFRRKALIFDKDDFKGPVWQSKTGENFNVRFVPIEPQWQMEYKYEQLKP